MEEHGKQSVNHQAPDVLLNQAYWNERWTNQETGWDIGTASPAIVSYMEQYASKDAAVLIPGCGNAHEADALVKMGFTNITLIDFAPHAVAILQERYALYPQVSVVCDDFFLHNGTYDLILEQTFFCALDPTQRTDYVTKMASLLAENGKLVGLLFNHDFGQPNPPFGGSLSDYELLFLPYFHINTMEECYNSIKPRAKYELFVNMKKR